jgi:nucleotide-binding universal stress UspA family protein
VYRNGIIVGVDGSLGSRAALMWAADECRWRGLALLLLHAPNPADAALISIAGESGLRALDDAAGRLLDELSTVASARQPSVAVSSLLSHSAAADSLVDLSSGAAMIVVGSRGQGALGTMLGSVSTRVAAHAHCPVAVVPQLPYIRENRATSMPIVVGMSATAAGRHAMDFALAEASIRGADVLAIRGGPAAEASSMKRELDEFRSRFEQLSITGRLVPGDPAEEVLLAARTAQLLALGCHHSDDRWSTRLGPVATTVLHNAPCPVVVIGQVRRGDQWRERAGQFVSGMSADLSQG